MNVKNFKLLHFVNKLKDSGGMMFVGMTKDSKTEIHQYKQTIDALNEFFQEQKINAFPSVIFAQSLQAGITNLITVCFEKIHFIYQLKECRNGCSPTKYSHIRISS